MTRNWSRYIFIYYIPSALSVCCTWVSFLIPIVAMPGGPQIAARNGLLVTLFLSLTTILGTTILSNPRVNTAFTALTVWMLMQYTWIAGATAAFAYLLWHRRYHDWSEERLAEYNRRIDTIYIVTFIPGYFVTAALYFLVILVH